MDWKVMLAELAKELHTTADHLWSVLVKQAPIDSMCQVTSVVVFFFGGLALLISGIKWARKRDEERDDTSPGIVMAVIGMLVMVITVLAAALSAPGIMAGFYNPEYWALKQVMGLVK